MKKIFHFTYVISLFFTFQFDFIYPQEQDMFQVVGFATESGGITGGSGGDTITVNTGTDLQNALTAKRNINNPLVIYVEGIINLANSPDLSKIDVKEVSDVSVIGAGSGAEFDGIGIKIWKSSNIIIQNLKIHHVLSGEKDCIGIEGPSDHIWIDHCELYSEFQGVDKDYYDGLIDVKRESEYLTYSWNFLHDSWKTCLVGSSESDTYDRKLTMHHNYFLNCNSRLPLFRGSTGHFFNNYYKDIASTAINSRINSCVLIENNYFENAHNPWVSAYSDILGGGDTTGNILINSPFLYSDDTHELPSCSPVIPYEYSSVLHEAADVPALVMAFTGAGNLPTGHDSYSTPSVDRTGIEILNLSPNPVSGKVTVSIYSKNTQPIILSLVSLSGKRYRIFEGLFNNQGDQTIEADLSSYESGLYLLEMTSGTERSVRRLMIF